MTDQIDSTDSTFQPKPELKTQKLGVDSPAVFKNINTEPSPSINFVLMIMRNTAMPKEPY
jgi:hypothetical protein